jgi:hypothetical protein
MSQYETSSRFFGQKVKPPTIPTSARIVSKNADAHAKLRRNELNIQIEVLTALIEKNKNDPGLARQVIGWRKKLLELKVRAHVARPGARQ